MSIKHMTPDPLAFLFFFQAFLKVYKWEQLL